MPTTWPLEAGRYRVAVALLTLVFVAGIGLVTLGAVASFLWPQGDLDAQNELYVGGFSDYAIGAPKLVHGLWVIRVSESEFTALDPEAPSSGCPVRWRDDLLFRDLRTQDAVVGWFWDDCGEDPYNFYGQDGYHHKIPIRRYPVEVRGVSVVVDTSPRHVIEMPR